MGYPDTVVHVMMMDSPLQAGGNDHKEKGGPFPEDNMV
ncbi:hypothetical protein WL1483_4270 [Aeromonas schubertii]|uniref:Uncharacterized protein n=1 Tax=Aeromonas schubertii TaxID=652 RepID=A0A0S2SPZ0_9GAMM|nr:hypothetical protein WL1483_4270 [Aeromonas schubertii]